MCLCVGKVQNKICFVGKRICIDLIEGEAKKIIMKRKKVGKENENSLRFAEKLLICITEFSRRGYRASRKQLQKKKRRKKRKGYLRL